MFCKKCGKENDDINTFCTSCGSPMNDEAVTADKVSVKRSGGKAVMIIIIAAVVIVVLYLFKCGILGIPGSGNDIGEVIHGEFCCQVNDVIYYIDSEQQLCSIHLDGTDNSVIFEGIVSNVCSNCAAVYFNGEKDGIVNTYKYDPSTGELLQKSLDFDCFDVCQDDMIIGIINNIDPMDDMYNYENGYPPVGERTMMVVCDANLAFMTEGPVYGIGYVENISMDADDFYLTNSRDMIYSGNLYSGNLYQILHSGNQSQISDDYLDIDCKEIVADAQSKKILPYLYTLYYNDLSDNTIKIYKKINGSSKIQTAARELDCLDFAVNRRWIVYCSNGIKAKSEYREVLIADCKGEKIGMSGETVYFTRSEDGVLCRASVDGKGAEEIRAKNNSLKPEVKTLYDDGMHYRSYYRLPYIRGANSEALNDFNRFMFEKKVDMEQRFKYYDYDVRCWSDARYAALADENNIQIIFYFNTYGEHIFRTYNYNISEDKFETFSEVESFVDKNKAAKLINEYIKNNYGDGDAHSINASDISVSGYIDDANGNKLIYLRSDSGHAYNDAEIHVYDTADGSFVVFADKDDIFNTFLDQERFPNTVEPFEYDSKTDELERM